MALSVVKLIETFVNLQTESNGYLFEYGIPQQIQSRVNSRTFWARV